MFLALLDIIVCLAVHFGKESQLWDSGIEILDRSLGIACFLCCLDLSALSVTGLSLISILWLLTSAASFSQKLKHQ